MTIARRLTLCASLLMSMTLGACAEARDALAPQGWNPQTGAGNVSFFPADGTVRNLRSGAVIAQVPSPNAQDLWMAGDGTVSHLVVRGAFANCPAQHIVISTDGVRAHVERVGRCGEMLRFVETRTGMAAVNAQGDTWLYPETSNEVRRSGFVVGNGVYRGPETPIGTVAPPLNTMNAPRPMPGYQSNPYPVPPPTYRQPNRPAFRAEMPMNRSIGLSQLASQENLWNSPRVQFR